MYHHGISNGVFRHEYFDHFGQLLWWIKKLIRGLDGGNTMTWYTLYHNHYDTWYHHRLTL